jgi:hypothetical protein
MGAFSPECSQNRSDKCETPPVDSLRRTFYQRHFESSCRGCIFCQLIRIVYLYYLLVGRLSATLPTPSFEPPPAFIQVTASSDSQLSMLDARGAIHGHRIGHGHAPGHKTRAPSGPTRGPEIGTVSRRLGAFQHAAFCVDIDGVRIVAGGEGPSNVLKVWDFSQVSGSRGKLALSQGSAHSAIGGFLLKMFFLVCGRLLADREIGETGGSRDEGVDLSHRLPEMRC